MEEAVDFDESDFSEFSSGDSKPIENGHHHQSETPGGDDVDDDFGDFASPEREKHEGNGIDSLGNSIEVSTQTPKSDAALPTDKSDDFGGFNDSAAPSAILNQTDKNGLEKSGEQIQGITPQLQPSSGDDASFGDFAGADSNEVKIGVSCASDLAQAANKSTSDDAFKASANPNDGGDVDDDFGGFGSDIPARNTTGTPDKLGIGSVQDTSCDDNSGFGDFAAPGSDAPERNLSDKIATTANENLDKPAISSKDDDRAKDNDDEFGDFERTPATNKNEDHQTNGNDDFGDFETAPAKNKNDEEKVNDDSDEFGDFNRTPVTNGNQEGKANDEDDEFGDFETTPSSAPILTKSTEDTFGDFGDVNENTPTLSEAPVSSSSVSFDASFASELQREQSAEISDPLLQKATSVFSKVYEKFSLPEASEYNESASKSLTIAELISLAEHHQPCEADENSMEKLNAVLKEIRKDPSPPLYIVSTENDRYCPNEHFSVPFVPPSFGFDSRSVFHADITARETWKEPPSSPQSATDDQRNTSYSTTTNNSSSDKWRQLLQQIPDLAFMLQSKLFTNTHKINIEKRGAVVKHTEEGIS